MQNIMEILYCLCGDYGIAVVLLTVGIRCLLLPLSIRQRKQLKKQQEISAAARQLQDRYKNNQQKLNEELQKLYREKGFGGTGCLISLLQFPVMAWLFSQIRSAAAPGTTTVLLPWVTSLVERDQTFLLPAATLAVQLLPQLYPYISCFSRLKLPKPNASLLFAQLVISSTFAFTIPSGVGLYYFVYGLFSAVEQAVVLRCRSGPSHSLDA